VRTDTCAGIGVSSTTIQIVIDMPAQTELNWIEVDYTGTSLQIGGPCL